MILRAHTEINFINGWMGAQPHSLNVLTWSESIWTLFWPHINLKRTCRHFSSLKPLILSGTTLSVKSCL